MSAIPTRAGVGLKPDHYAHIIERGPDVGWFEAHPENYMGVGGPPHRYLERVRREYPLSFHGVGLSLGSVTPPDADHLARLRTLIGRYAPGLVSEHLAWSAAEGTYFPDLLPLPYTSASLDAASDNIARAQDALGVRLLIENPSTYLRLAESDMGEAEFLISLCRRAGCGILLDVNNLYVSAGNVGGDPAASLVVIPPDLVGEVHLAGHAVTSRGGMTVRIDDHGSPVSDPVWRLFAKALELFGPVPTLIEWDTAVPTFEILGAEAAKADAILARTAGGDRSRAA